MPFGVDVGPGEADVLETGVAKLLQRTPLLADLHRQLERQKGPDIQPAKPAVALPEADRGNARCAMVVLRPGHRRAVLKLNLSFLLA